MVPHEFRAQFDHASWETDRTLKSIAAEFGVPVAKVNEAATPLPAGRDCWWCGQPIVFRSRAERADSLKAWSRFHCRCRARPLRSADRPGLRPSDVAALKAGFPLAYAEAFAAATATAHDAVLWAGDPELLVPGAPWRHRDVR